MIMYFAKAGMTALGIATVIAVGGAATLSGVHFFTKKKDADKTQEADQPQESEATA